MNIEVEVKTRLDVPDIKELRAVLLKSGATLRTVVTEEDVYFNSPSVDFAVTDEALRIRKTLDADETDENDGITGAVLTYKGPKIHADSKSRREINIEIIPGTMESMMELFTLLGFRKAGTVRKRREMFSFRGFDVLLDRIDGLGDFLEIERIVPDDGDIDGLVAEMKCLIPTLNNNKWITRSYLEMCLAGDRE